MKNILFLSAFLLLVSTVSLGQNLDKETDAFPPDFGKDETFLYVETVPGYFMVNGALEKTFDKHYTGKYAIYDMREIPNESNRKEGTHYYLFRTLYDVQEGSFGAGGRDPGTTNYSFGVTDLRDGKQYKLSFYGGAYKKLMEAYVKKLEAVRLANEKSR